MQLKLFVKKGDIDMKICVDACVFVSSLVKEDPFFEASRKFLREITQNRIKITMPILTFYEILHVYFKATGSVDLCKGLEQQLMTLNGAKNLHLSPLEAEFTAHFLGNHMEFSSKTSDTVLAIHSMQQKCPLISWDKGLIKACEGQVQAMTPEDFLAKLRA